jgi:hypothetical protein
MEITLVQTIPIERVDHIGIRVRNLDTTRFVIDLGEVLLGRSRNDGGRQASARSEPDSRSPASS